MRRIREESGNIYIELTEVTCEDWIVFTVNGRELFAVDMMYTEPEHKDPSDNAPDEPHVNVGWWPRPEEWTVMGHLPLTGPYNTED